MQVIMQIHSTNFKLNVFEHSYIITCGDGMPDPSDWHHSSFNAIAIFIFDNSFNSHMHLYVCIDSIQYQVAGV